MLLQDPDAGPPMVGDACTKVSSVSVPKQTVYWTCGIAVKGDYACGGGTPILRCLTASNLDMQPSIKLSIGQLCRLCDPQVPRSIKKCAGYASFCKPANCCSCMVSMVKVHGAIFSGDCAGGLGGPPSISSIPCSTQQNGLVMMTTQTS